MRRSGFYDSRYDPEALRSLAVTANGHWIHAPEVEAFTAAFSRLDQEEIVIRRSGSIRREEPLYVFFILAALALLWGVRFVRRYILGALL
jgi:Ca-activated chloride channel family protein